jgi:hypothetical protein
LLKGFGRAMEKTKRLKTFSGAAAAAVVSLLILVLNLLGVWRGCVFRAVTGIACPTCGMTRAYLSLLKLDLKSAFYYHPLFWVVPAIAGLLLIKKAGSKSRIAVLSLAAAAFLVVYLLRLFVFSDSLIYY